LNNTHPVKIFNHQLAILGVNPGEYTSGRMYPIQPYRMDEGVNFSFPSRPYDNFVAFYHQIGIDENESGKIYPAGNSAVVCRLNNRRPQSFLVGTPTFPCKAEYVVSKSEYFVALQTGVGRHVDDVSVSLGTELLHGVFANKITAF
jgi:hypothetical protein